MDRSASTDFGQLNPEVRTILSSLMIRETRVGSIVVQGEIVNSFERQLIMLRNPARKARFAVLRSVRMPSVLVEMGFMSNRLDERLLRQPRHRSVIAGALTTAINAYFQKSDSATLMRG